jgi:hypothetical protein
MRLRAILSTGKAGLGCAAITLALGAFLLATPAQAAPTSASTTSSAQPQNTSSLANGWLAFVVLAVGAGLGIGLIAMVSRDRQQSRVKVLEALRAGADAVSQTDTTLGGGLSGGGPPGASITIAADHDVIAVGSSSTLTASFNDQAEPCLWSFEPPGIVSPSGDGPNANLVVTAVKAGSVTATATAYSPPDPANPPEPGTKQLTVSAVPKGSAVSFSILGAGLGTAILAILAISGAIALALRGDFTAEIGTLLGTALGAGAAGTVSAIHGGSNSTQSPTNSNQAPSS